MLLHSPLTTFPQCTSSVPRHSQFSPITAVSPPSLHHLPPPSLFSRRRLSFILPCLLDGILNQTYTYSCTCSLCCLSLSTTRSSLSKLRSASIS
ncbi:hypothetical protein E2C01_057212 [Portunus trituberculatus]|uniref:Uncharacterized protein n=1 Tax=Portunus trituberculatus TaxID=210409 RepID=A0A5B7H1R2_PORTR|nr:hypothetical protein [Portunus trituberculatus]